MCGIVGFVNTTYSKDEKADQLEQMMARIVHRAPITQANLLMKAWD